MYTSVGALPDVHDFTSLFSAEISIHGLKCEGITRHSESDSRFVYQSIPGSFEPLPDPGSSDAFIWSN